MTTAWEKHHDTTNRSQPLLPLLKICRPFLSHDFFGVPNLILGNWIIKSPRFPSPFGFGLIAAALVYLLGSYTRFLVPGHMALVAPLYAIALVAELSFALWLLIKGVRA